MAELGAAILAVREDPAAPLSREQEIARQAGNVLRNEILAALSELTAALANPAPDAAAVHAMRRVSKRLRALSDLAGGSLHVLARETKHHADTLRRSAGGARDAAVRRQVLESLANALGHAMPVLEKALGAADTGAAESPRFPGLTDRVSALTRDWTLCDPAELGTREILKAARKTYGSARRRGKKAGVLTSGKRGRSDELHRWRRAIVDHETHLQCLGKLGLDTKREAKDAHLLRDHLGKIHDLHALAQFMKTADGVDRDALAALETAAKRASKTLLRKVERRGRSIFAERAAAWEKRLEKTQA